MLPRWLPVTSSLVLLALLAWTCAHWFWVFAAPEPAVLAAQVEPGPRSPLESIARANLYGASAPQPVVLAVQSDLMLRGISSTRKGGMAVIAIDKGKTVAVGNGDEIVPGVRLEKVLPDHVVISRGGVPQRLDLPQRKPTDTPPVKSSAAAPAKK